MDAKELGKAFALGQVAEDVRDVNGMEHDKNGKFTSKGSHGGVAKGATTNNKSVSLQTTSNTGSQENPVAQPQGNQKMNKSEIVQFLRKLADAVERAQKDVGEDDHWITLENGQHVPAPDGVRAPITTGKGKNKVTTFKKIGTSTNYNDHRIAKQTAPKTGKAVKVVGPKAFPKKSTGMSKLGKGLSKLKV